MVKGILRFVVGCAHERTTFPLTPSSRKVTSGRITAIAGAYVACLDCGKEFAYDWARMRVGEPVRRRREATPEQHLQTLIG